MYQALYRKWRPQTFDDVIGQKHITDSLRNQVSSGHLSHAYIFIGTRGTGKTTCARILAKAVNCEHPVNGNPCCECASCRGIADGSIMDVVELDAASNNGVDSVRALRDEAAFSPADVRKRVYIIDEVHMLSMSAFNALLKIIEEPPEHLMFVLATTELQKVPATILSRCQRHTFRRIDRAELTAYVEHVASAENIVIGHDAADLIAGLAEGGVRDALSMLDQCSVYGTIGTEQVYSAVGLAGNQRILDLFGFICSHDTSSAVQLFDTLWRDGKDPSSLLKELAGLVRDILVEKVAPDAASGLVYGGYDEAVLRRFASARTTEELSAALGTIQNAIGAMTMRSNPRMTAELCIISLSGSLAGDSVESLRARISALENAVSTGAPVIGDRLQPADIPKAAKVPARITEEKHESVPEQVKIPVQKTEPSPKPENGNDFWRGISDYMLELLPFDARAWFKDPDIVRSRIDGDLLTVEVIGDFRVRRINSPDIISRFESATSVVLGKKLNVRIVEAVQQAAEQAGSEPKGKLDDLRKYPEVTFIK